MKHKERMQNLAGLLTLVLAMSLVGCEGSSAQNTEELPQEENQVEAGTLPSEVGTEEPETPPGEEKEEPQAEEGDAQEEQESAAEKKEPPEGWELTFASEDWGLSFGESGKRFVNIFDIKQRNLFSVFYNRTSHRVRPGSHTVDVRLRDLQTLDGSLSGEIQFLRRKQISGIGNSLCLSGWDQRDLYHRLAAA